MDVYNHTQSSPNSTWTVTHNLNTDAVAVDVFIDYLGNLEKILPLDIVVTDSNTLTITFTTSQTGKARIIGTTNAI